MTGLNKLRLAAGVVAAGAALYFGVLLARWPAARPAADIPIQPADWPAPAVPPDDDWAAIHRTATPQAEDMGPLARRFRLAGMFFAFAERDGADSASRYAVLDDIERKQQFLVREGDRLDDLRVLRILTDRILLESRGKEEELRLSFLGGDEQKTETADETTEVEEPALEVNRFGRRVAEDRWLLNRQALLDYYQELADDPERIAALYMTMKPDYQGEAIAGYVVDIEGEADFLAAMGLRQNDVIRKVNSMNMTSQMRAEYFISEFLQDRVSAIVLDMERDSQAQRLIYLIR